jgi:hypothetical protein
MLGFKILASAIPLIVVGVLADSEWAPAARPCITLGETAVRMAAGPWQAQRKVGFTDDPALATVRVQIVDGAEAADFAYVDDIDDTQASACDVTAATRFIAIAASPSAAEPVIYLSHGGNADYRIFVKSKRFTAREAAALIVDARGGHAGIASAAL